MTEEEDENKFIAFAKEAIFMFSNCLCGDNAQPCPKHDRDLWLVWLAALGYKYYFRKNTKDSAVRYHYSATYGIAPLHHNGNRDHLLYAVGSGALDDSLHKANVLEDIALARAGVIYAWYRGEDYRLGSKPTNGDYTAHAEVLMELSGEGWQ